LSRFLSQTKFTVASATTFTITTLSITTPSVTLKDLKMFCCAVIRLAMLSVVIPSADKTSVIMVSVVAPSRTRRNEL